MPFVPSLSRQFLAAASLATAAMIALPQQGHAHEFMIGLDAADPATARIEATHIIIEPEHMEEPSQVDVHVVSNAGDVRKVLEQPGPQQLGLTVDLTPHEDGAWLLAHRLPQVWSKTAQGWKFGGKDRYPNGERADMYEKFAKMPINDQVSGLKPLGHELEIVPDKSLATLKVGDTLPVMILHRGKPLIAPIWASYHGYDTSGVEPVVWAQTDKTPSQGTRGPVMEVEINKPGTWVIRTQHWTKGPQGVDMHVMRATMTFEAPAK